MATCIGEYDDDDDDDDDEDEDHDNAVEVISSTCIVRLIHLRLLITRIMQPAPIKATQ